MNFLYVDTYCDTRLLLLLVRKRNGKIFKTCLITALNETLIIALLLLMTKAPTKQYV